MRLKDVVIELEITAIAVDMIGREGLADCILEFATSLNAHPQFDERHWWYASDLEVECEALDISPKAFRDCKNLITKVLRGNAAKARKARMEADKSMFTLQNIARLR